MRSSQEGIYSPHPKVTPSWTIVCLRASKGLLRASRCAADPVSNDAGCYHLEEHWRSMSVQSPAHMRPCVAWRY